MVLVVDPPLGRQEPARLPAGRQGYPTDLNAYLHIGADGRVTCLVGKIEMGQGAMTSLPQLVAEELDVPLASVDIVMGDTDLCPWDMGTFGSLSIRQFGPVLRAAAAEARAVLLQLAAERLRRAGGGPARCRGTASVVTRERRQEACHLRPADRGQAHRERLDGRRRSKAVVGLHGRRHVGAAARRAGEGDGQGEVRRRHRAARRAARAHPAAAGARRHARPPSTRRPPRRVPGVRVVRDGDLVAVLHAHRDEADRALALVKATFAPSPSTLDDRTSSTTS